MDQEQQVDPEFRNNTGDFSLSVSWNGTEHSEDYFYGFKLQGIAELLQILFALFGLVGNGIVIWLLGFHMKRNTFSVYILNLACADLTFLLFNCLVKTHFYLGWYSIVFHVFTSSAELSSFVVSVCLLMAISIERCVSVLCPIWYRCHRPVHLSSILCALIWVLAFGAVSSWTWCSTFVDLSCYGINLAYNGLCIITFVVMFVSSLTLLIQVQCCSRRRRSSRLYVTILLNVLAFLLLNLPFTVYHMIHLTSVPFSYYITDVHFFRFLMVLNSMVNPIIYFFVGRYRQGRKPLQQVLQSALNHEEGGVEQRRETPVPREDRMLP